MPAGVNIYWRAVMTDAGRRASEDMQAYVSNGQNVNLIEYVCARSEQNPCVLPLGRQSLPVQQRDKFSPK